MATNFPGSLDTSSQQPSPSSTTDLDASGYEHDVVHTNHSGAIIALETKLGSTDSNPTANAVLMGTGSGTSEWDTSPTFKGAVTVGVDDTGHDVKFFGATSGSYMEWDESADTLNVVGLMTLHGGTRSVQVTNSSNNANIVVGVGSDTASKRGSIIFERSDGSIASPTAVDDNDYLGELVFKGYDGDEMVTGARIRVLCNGTTGNNDMPAELVFMTTADGASDSTARMRILAGGDVEIDDGNLTLAHDSSDNNISLGGAGTGYTHASIKLSATGDSRGTGTYGFNGYNDTTWFWGNPYAYEDSFRVCRKSSTTSLDVAAAHGGSYELLKLFSDGDMTIEGTLTENSDSRLKREIADSSLGLDFVNALKPREYRRVDGVRKHYGFIAQEVAAVLPNADDNGIWVNNIADVSGPDEEESLVSTQGLRYTHLIAPLVKAVQELTTRVAALEG